jgi:hypothetical protein
MSDWVETLRSAALEWRPPLSPLQRLGVDRRAAQLPPDLQQLYAASNGVRLPAGLRLYPLEGGPGEPSTLSQGAAAKMWRFGRVREHVSLFAVQKQHIRGRADGSPPPEWLKSAASEAWVYGLRNDDNLRTRLFPSLARMLEALLPDRLPPLAEAPAAPPQELPPEEVDLEDVAAEDSVEVEIAVEEPSLQLDIVEAPAELAAPVPAKRKRRPARQQRPPARKKPAKEQAKAKGKPKRRRRRN